MVAAACKATPVQRHAPKRLGRSLAQARQRQGGMPWYVGPQGGTLSLWNEFFDRSRNFDKAARYSHIDCKQIVSTWLSKTKCLIARKLIRTSCKIACLTNKISALRTRVSMYYRFTQTVQNKTTYPTVIIVGSVLVRFGTNSVVLKMSAIVFDPSAQWFWLWLWETQVDLRAYSIQTKKSRNLRNGRSMFLKNIHVCVCKLLK